MVPPLTWTRARFNESTAATWFAEVWKRRPQLCIEEEDTSELRWVMASIDVLKERFLSYEKMYSQELREQSFVDWPFREDCTCTPEKVKQFNLFSK